MRIIAHIFDALFHPRETERLLRNLDTLPTTSGGVYDSVIFLARYKDLVVHAAITENKYYDNKRAAKLLSDLVQQWRNKQAENIVFVPIPLSPKRLKERGYNQVTRVLEPLQDSETMIFETVLRRTIDTLPQTTLTGDERRANMRGAFEIKTPNNFSKLENVTIVLVDDVLTTGATINEARATLAPHLPPSTTFACLTFAH